MNNCAPRGLDTTMAETTVSGGASVVTAQSGARPDDSWPDDAAGPERRMIEELSELCLSGTHSAGSDFVDRLIGDGLSSRIIAEILVPGASRLVGDRWCLDTLGFAHVTIACARLTRILRDMETHDGRIADPFHAPQVLVLVARDAQHTMGGTVLAGMLRRRGIDARLILEADAAAIGAHLFRCSYDAVLLSSSSGEPLDQLRRLIGCIRAAAPQTPTVLGGTIIGTCGDAGEVARLTGAGLVTNDLGDALRHCDITAPSDSAADRPHLYTSQMAPVAAAESRR